MSWMSSAEVELVVGNTLNMSRLHRNAFSSLQIERAKKLLCIRPVGSFAHRNIVNLRYTWHEVHQAGKEQLGVAH